MAGTCLLIKTDAGGRHEQIIGYSLTTPLELPDSEKRLIIMGSQWSEYATRAPQEDRAEAIATVLGIPVLAIDMPGQSPESSGLTYVQKQGIKRGDFSVLGQSLWDTASLAVSRERKKSLLEHEVILLGMSQASSIVSSMLATAPEKVAISDVVNWNGPAIANSGDRSARGLLRDFVVDGPKDDKLYKDRNPGWAYREGPLELARVLRRPRGHILSFLGLARANDAKTLAACLTGEKGFNGRIHIVHSALDTVSAARDNEAAARLLKGLPGTDVRWAPLPGEHHAVLNHLPAIAAVMQQVVRLEY